MDLKWTLDSWCAFIFKSCFCEHCVWKALVTKSNSLWYSKTFPELTLRVRATVLTAYAESEKRLNSWNDSCAKTIGKISARPMCRSPLHLAFATIRVSGICPHQICLLEISVHYHPRTGQQPSNKCARTMLVLATTMAIKIHWFTWFT